MAKTPSKNGDSTATSDCEAQYRLTADKLRNNLDAADSPHAVQDLIFRDYSSDNPMPVNESAWFRKGHDGNRHAISAPAPAA
jgi:hypothetical protein